jgi:hypothetical protein
MYFTIFVVKAPKISDKKESVINKRQEERIQIQYERRAEALGNKGGRKPLVCRSKYKLSDPFQSPRVP